MGLLMHRRGVAVPLADVLDLIERKNLERDEAYQTGARDGYVQGVEDGLRERLVDAELAMGRAA